MKKLVALILTLCLLCGATAFATEINENSEKNEYEQHQAEMKLTLELEGGYTVIIPTELNFGEPIMTDDQEGEMEGHHYFKAEATISVPKAKMSEAILVVYSPTSGEDGFVLLNEDQSESIGYRYVGADVVEGEGEILPGGEMTVARNNTCDFKLTFETDSSTLDGFPSGVFTDTLSFSVAVEG